MNADIIISNTDAAFLYKSLIKKKFTLCWRWFYRMQIPLIIGYHKFMQDLSTFHVWGTICMNQSLNVTKNLKNIEGNIKFLIKDFESKATLPDSTFLKALKIFNLNAIIENINNETSITSPNLYINRAEGNFYIGKNRALISNPIKVETSEAKMRWLGEVIKDSDGLLNELSLDLEMRLKVSENIRWYAAIFGGIPALAGGLFFENIFDERIDDVSCLLYTSDAADE